MTAVYALYAMAFGLVFFMGLIKGLTDPRVFSMPSFFVILACFIFLTMAVFKPGLRVITRLVAALHLLLGLPLAFFLGKVNEATRGYSDLNELLLVLVLPPSIVLFAAVIEHFQGRKRSHA